MQRDLTILQGKTFSQVVRWESEPFIYKTITGITAAAPPRLTVPTHGVPNGWRVAVSNVQGMKEINAQNEPPRPSEYKNASVISNDTLELNTVNAAGYSAYVTGGILRYYTPVDIAGFAARMTIRNRVGGTELLSLTTENGRIIVDDAEKRIELLISAEDTEDITWKRGVYDLEMVNGTVVTQIIAGAVAVLQEVTT